MRIGDCGSYWRLPIGDWRAIDDHQSAIRSAIRNRESAMTIDSLVIADKAFRSRLIVGTGKYPSHTIMRDAHRAAGTEMVTVAVRRGNLTDKTKEKPIDYIDRQSTFIP